MAGWNKLKIIVIPLSALCLFFFLSNAQAQQARPQFLLTWQTQSYTPAQFQGKALPTANSQITASAELINGGKILDISKNTIYWYLNDNLLSSGAGAQTVVFNAPPTSDSDHLELRVQLPDYEGSTLLKTVNIPLVDPEVVILSPYPDKQFSGASASVSALPYFFNTTALSGLSFAWNVNGEVSQNAEDPADLTISVNSDAPSGSTINISVAAQNQQNAAETASANVVLKILK